MLMAVAVGIFVVAQVEISAAGAELSTLSKATTQHHYAARSAQWARELSLNGINSVNEQAMRADMDVLKAALHTMCVAGFVCPHVVCPHVVCPYVVIFTHVDPAQSFRRCTPCVRGRVVAHSKHQRGHVRGSHQAGVGGCRGLCYCDRSSLQVRRQRHVVHNAYEFVRSWQPAGRAHVCSGAGRSRQQLQ